MSSDNSRTGSDQNKYRRIDLAKEQLDVGLQLFLDDVSYASAITLVGAAEEPLGQELRRRGLQPVLDWKFGKMEVLHQLLHGSDLKMKTFVEGENRVRNALKHFDGDADHEMIVDLQESACWMLVRACDNAQHLGIAVARFDEFDEWFFKNIVGAE